VSASDLAATLSASRRHDIEFRELMRPERRRTFEAVRPRIESAKRYATTLSSVPRQTRQHEIFLGPMEDEDAILRTSMEQSLTRMARMGTRPIEFRFTDDDFRRMGLVAPTRLEETLELDHEMLCQLMSARRTGTALHEAVDLLQQRRREVQGQSDVDDLLSGGAGDGGPEGEEDAATTATPDMELVATGIRQQITDLAVPAAAAASSLEALGARVAGFRLPPGPADVTSIHDFHQLQIAFQHVWTEAFDEDLREQVENYYQTVAELHEDYGGTFDLPAEGGEIDEFAALLRDSARDVETLASEAAPTDVSGVWGEDVSRWHLLNEQQQAELASLGGWQAEPAARQPALSRPRQLGRRGSSQALGPGRRLRRALPGLGCRG
jgi:hypothetical protein